MYIHYVILDDESGSWSWFSSSMFLWLFNFIVLLICLIKMFVYGEPVMPSKSKESQNFWRFRRQADFYLSKVSFVFKLCSKLF